MAITLTRSPSVSHSSRSNVPMLLFPCVLVLTLLVTPTLTTTLSVTPPWIPPAVNSSDLIPFLRDTSRPKLAYSTWVGWYTDGGLNETTLFAQVDVMATTLRPHGWTHVLHDYGWQVCGSTDHVEMGCIYVDQHGRLFPSPERYPSTVVNTTFGTWKPFVDRVHARGIAYGLHLMHGVPKIAVAKKLNILGTNWTCDEIADTSCQTFIPDHWAINISHPGAQAYFDSVVAVWAEQGIDFIYFDGVVADCGRCHIDEVSLLSDSLKRLGNGMHLFVSAGPPSDAIGCPFDALSALAPYVRVGADTVDSWSGAVESGFSIYTRLTAPAFSPHHFGDLASLMIGKVHCNHGAPGRNCGPGPDYVIPSAESSMTKDEVISYASMVAMARSTWWPSGALTEMDSFMTNMLTNDDVIRITMASQHTRQTIDRTSKSFAGPGIVWTSDDSMEPDFKYVLLVNLGLNTTDVAVDFYELGLDEAEGYECDVMELWNGTSLAKASVYVSATLRSHASSLLKLSRCSF
eukprot:m.57703 g.57703  ORF g.57703 m.57703 type:complete len:517 (+) comp22424_c0_seq1:423-1973(+)